MLRVREMNFLRNLSKVRCVGVPISTRPSIGLSKRFSGSDHHHVEEPTRGYLFGRPPGEKVAMEYWEPVWYFGYYGTAIAMLIGYFFFHDRSSIEDRARIEAHKRMASKGEQFGWPLPPDYALVELVAEDAE